MNVRNFFSKYRFLIAGIAVVLFAAVFYTTYLFNKKFADTVELQPDYTMNAMLLMDEFKTNHAASGVKYNEKIIEVSGIVSEMEEADSVTNVKMKNEDTGDYIIFTFQKMHQKAVKKIKEGEKVTIKASCSGAVYSDILGITYISFKRAALII